MSGSERWSGGGGERLVNGSGLSAIAGTETQRAAPRERPRLYDTLLRGEGRGKCDEVEGCRWMAGKGVGGKRGTDVMALIGTGQITLKHMLPHTSGGIWPCWEFGFIRSSPVFYSIYHTLWVFSVYFWSHLSRTATASVYLTRGRCLIALHF